MGATNTDNLAAPKPISTNQLDTDVERIRTAFDTFDTAIAARATAAALTAHVNDPAAHGLSGLTPASIGALADTPGSVTDSNIGNRTVTPDSAPSGSTGTLTALLSGLANRIRAITGATNWWDAPPVSLTGAQSHIGNTSNPHGTTAAQVGAIPATANQVTDTHIGSRTVNPALATPGNSGTLTQILSWLAGRIQAITGATNWYDTPATTLSGAAAHHSNTGNPHGTTAAQVASASGFSGAWSISISGNAATATSAARLTNARTINGVSFDGSASVAIPLVKSIRRSTITLTSQETTKTYSITPAVDVTKTFVTHLGVTTSGVGLPSVANSSVSLTLTNGSTLTATRADDGVTATVSFEIIESY